MVGTLGILRLTTVSALCSLIVAQTNVNDPLGLGSVGSALANEASQFSTSVLQTLVPQQPQAPPQAVTITTTATTQLTMTAPGQTVTQPGQTVTVSGPAQPAFTNTVMTTMTKMMTIDRTVTATATVDTTVAVTQTIAASNGSPPVTVTINGDQNNGSPIAGAGADHAPTAGGPAPGVKIEKDPAKAIFLGQSPDPIPDVPIAAIFLVMFVAGAITHISIYKANAIRGHKFLLSDLMFDFCMIRILTSIFRILWSFIHPRGVIMMALILEFGGAAVIFIVNLFFAQRIVRSMHPRIGWHPLFGIVTLFLIWSVPAIIVLQITVIITSFFSVGNDDRLNATETALKFGSAYALFLCVSPLILLFMAAAIPAKKRPEKFGYGSLQTKVAILVYGATTLTVGAAVRLTTLLNPVVPPNPPGPIFGKGVFYTTNLTLEILVVGLYAVARIDLRFHIPNGSSKAGDYSADRRNTAVRPLIEMQYEIEEQLGNLGVDYQMINVPFHIDDQTEVLIAKLSTHKRPESGSGGENDDHSANASVLVPPRPRRVSRRNTIVDGINAIRPSRPRRSTSHSTHNNRRTFLDTPTSRDEPVPSMFGQPQQERERPESGLAEGGPPPLSRNGFPVPLRDRFFTLSEKF